MVRFHFIISFYRMKKKQSMKRERKKKASELVIKFQKENVSLDDLEEALKMMKKSRKLCSSE